MWITKTKTKSASPSAHVRGRGGERLRVMMKVASDERERQATMPDFFVSLIGGTTASGVSLS
jgi:hypothetical protein